MGILKKIWDMLPEGRPICVPKPEAWGVKQEEDKESLLFGRECGKQMLEF